VLASSLVALLAVVATGASLRPSATSAAGILVGIIVILLLALSVVALIAVITDTGSLRRRDPGRPHGCRWPHVTPSGGRQERDLYAAVVQHDVRSP
jgi:hypothetical protein